MRPAASPWSDVSTRARAWRAADKAALAHPAASCPGDLPAARGRLERPLFGRHVKRQFCVPLSRVSWIRARGASSFSCPIRAEAREAAEKAAYARLSIAMLGRLLLLSGAAGALRAPGRSGSLPKKPQRGGRVIDTAELFVANLPDSDRDDFLEFARSAFPAVRRVTVPRDRSTGAARGFVATRVHFFVSSAP